MSYNIELLTNQITVAEKLLKKVAFIPDGRQDMYGIVFYDKELVQIISNEEDEWERETVEYLILIYGDKSRQVEEFKRCLAHKNQYFNFREDLKKDLNSCIATLKAFKNAYEIKSHLAAQQPVEKSSKPPKIFISHKSEDRLFVKELVRMLEFIVGTSEKNIFCSSIPGYDIKPSREILKELKKQFEENEVYFIIVHSPRYYKSSICLNEMGAAWVLGTKFCSFLTSDCEFKMLNGAFDRRYISIKINDEQETVVSKLNSFKDELLEVFSIQDFNYNRWETIRNEFIEKTCQIVYNEENEEEEKQDASLKAKAVIVTDIIMTKPIMIDISNRGDVSAENLNISLEDKCEGMIITGLDHFPLEYLRPGRHVRLNWHQCIGDPTQFKLFFSWKENGKDYSSEDIIIV